MAEELLDSEEGLYCVEFVNLTKHFCNIISLCLLITAYWWFYLIMVETCCRKINDCVTFKVLCSFGCFTWRHTCIHIPLDSPCIERSLKLQKGGGGGRENQITQFVSNTSPILSTVQFIWNWSGCKDPNTFQYYSLSLYMIILHISFLSSKHKFQLWKWNGKLKAF